jgi:hypothetical protein
VPYNVPTVTTDDISFGPAVLYAGVAGATPTVDVGSITEDGISIEITSEKRSIAQGNPRIPVFAFSQAQGAMVKVTGIEWDYQNFAHALGAGVTTSSGSEETFAFGGDPILTEMALHVQHYMAVSGNTLNVYVWKAVSEGGLTLPLGQDEHQFEFSFMALRSETNWAGDTLSADQQLLQLWREL